MARGTTNLRPFSASSHPSKSKSRSQSDRPSGNGASRRGASSGGDSSGRNLDPSSAYTYLPSLPKRARRSDPSLISGNKQQARAGSSSRRVRGRYSTGGADQVDENDKDEDEDDDDDDDDAMSSRVRKIAMMIAADEGGVVDDDDDEDLDSDEAWEEGGSDDERWGDVFRDLDKGKKDKGKKVKAVEKVLKPAKPLMVNLDESDQERPAAAKLTQAGKKATVEDEEMDDDDHENDEDEDNKEQEEGEDDEEQEEVGEDEDEEDDEDEEEDDEEEDDDPQLPSDLSDDDDDEDDDVDGLDAFVDQLAAADNSRKALPPSTTSAPSKSRRVLPVVPAPSSGDTTDLALRPGQKLDISSLIASHPSLSSASALLPSKSDRKSNSVLRSGILPAPLPTVAQARIDRQAAYEQTREEGAKWAGVMKRVKEAEHLSFPLQASERGGVKSAGEVLSTFKPQSEHESAVEALLRSANLTDSGVKAAEDEALRGQDLSPEEIAARRAELRHQRELMFRAEAKAKRVAKIKSKTFRKLARKREAKAGGDGGTAGVNAGISLDDLERLDPEAAADERERLEMERARERATLRHGAKTGRWARSVGNDGMEDIDARRERQEMLDIKERLQRKIHGRGSSEEDDSDEDDDSDEGEDEDEEVIKSRAFDQLAKLNANDQEGEGQMKKGLMQMAFMKKAQEREMKKVAEQEAEFRKELEEDDDEDEQEDEDEASMMKIGEGRMVFSGPFSTSTSTNGQSTTQKFQQQSQPKSVSPPPFESPFGAINPWLDTTAASSGPSRKRNVDLGASLTAEVKAVRALKKARRDREGDLDDERVEIDVDLTSDKGSKGQKKVRVQMERDKDEDDVDEDEDDEDEDELMPVNGLKAFSQRDLVAEAFAGDNVVQDFALEKQKQIESDAPQVEDTTLPGWGSWGGKGTRKRSTKPNSRFLKTTPGIAASDRKDAGRDNVIISEKKDKKAANFLVKDLPYPYTSKAQYEASFQTPVGSEWNSRAGFQRGTLPRVMKKPGAIIEPIRRLF